MNKKGYIPVIVLLAPVIATAVMLIASHLQSKQPKNDRVVTTGNRGIGVGGNGFHTVNK